MADPEVRQAAAWIAERRAPPLSVETRSTVMP
jgi:hypothetical protein